MHDIDRTQAEYTTWGEVDGLEMDEFSYLGEQESGEFGFMGEQEQGYYGETGGIFSEADEIQLAAELLDISSEAELEQFLGRLVRRAASAVGQAIRSPVGRQITGMLRGVARQALPMAGGALGNLVAPGIGGMVGSKLASSAGSMLGLELEGLSPEDQEFEVARQIVRLGGEAVRQAATAPPGAPPQAVAQTAVRAAAQQYAPGLLGRTGAGVNGAAGMGATGAGRMGAIGGRQTGRWYRRGNRIVLIGV